MVSACAASIPWNDISMTSPIRSQLTISPQ